MSQIILYQSEDGRTKLDVRLEGQTVWLSQKQLTELFGKAKGTISEHITHIFEDGELEETSVVRFFRTTAADGKSYEVAHYNLDMVLALGFRVRSPMAVRFRQWAADKLKEYITKGFVLDDDRLKNPQAGNDYFEELIQPVPGFPMPTKRKALSESPTAKEGSAYHCAPAEVWKCYARLHGNRVKTLEPGEALTNLISLVRFATGQQADLAPFPVLARQRFSDRLNQQETVAGHPNSNFHEFEGIGNQAGPHIP